MEHQENLLRISTDHETTLSDLRKEQIPALLLSQVRKNDVYAELLQSYGAHILDLEAPAGFHGDLGRSFTHQLNQNKPGERWSFSPVYAPYTNMADSIAQREEFWGTEAYHLGSEFMIQECIRTMHQRLQEAGIPLCDRYCEHDGYVRSLRPDDTDSLPGMISSLKSSHSRMFRGEQIDTAKGPLLSDEVTIFSALFYQLYQAAQQKASHLIMVGEQSQIHLLEYSDFFTTYISHLREYYPWMTALPEVRLIELTWLRYIPTENDSIKYYRTFERSIQSSQERDIRLPSRQPSWEPASNIKELCIPERLADFPLKQLNNIGMFCSSKTTRTEGMAYTPYSFT